MNYNSINTREALAVSIFAFRANNNQVCKETSITPKLIQYSNKMYLEKYFGGKEIFPNVPLAVVSDDLLQEADRIKLSLEHYITFATLTKGCINDFVQNAYDAIKNETTNTRNFAILVWLPKLIADNECREAAREISAGLELKSKFIGKVSNRVTIKFNLIEKRFIRSINCWSAYGYTECGNLVKFLTKHEHLCVTGSIMGRIKSLDHDQFHHNARVTNLNHVKGV
jgi:hypothetical protein